MGLAPRCRRRWRTVRPPQFDLRRRVGPCFEIRRITWQRTYFSRDRMRTICLYQAPDASTVRDVHDQEGVPYERIWSASEVNELPAV